MLIFFIKVSICLLGMGKWFLKNNFVPLFENILQSFPYLEISYKRFTCIKIPLDYNWVACSMRFIVVTSMPHLSNYWQEQCRELPKKLYEVSRSTTLQILFWGKSLLNWQSNLFSRIAKYQRAVPQILYFYIKSYIIKWKRASRCIGNWVLQLYS